jgi:hypothetical protein
MLWSQVRILPGPPLNMINFKNVKKIVTHSGHAHRDDFLSVCFTLAMCAYENNSPSLERRKPTDHDLNDPNVVVLDVGEQHQPELSNFDHHQFHRNEVPACALTLLLKDIKIYEEANLGFRWLNVTEKFDSKGPYFVANEIGIEWNKISDATFSPIEEAILNRFSRYTKYHPKSDIYIMMRHIGEQLLKTLEQFTERWEILSETTKTLEIDNNLIVLSVGINGDDDPTFALNAYVDEKYPSAIATITLDDRGHGMCLFRLNDSSKIDFSQIENDPNILFAHKNGFVAKTHNILNDQKLTEIIKKSLT